MDWKEIVRKSDRYSDFSIVEVPKKFKEMFLNQDIPYVQVHSVQTYEVGSKSDIIGFCGSFTWMKNELDSLDGDSYNENMLVLGYQWFTDERGNKCLDVLVGNDW